MKNTSLVLLLFVVLISSLSAEFNAYGSARVGFWYDMQNKDLTGGESRTVFHHNLYTNSRFGVNWKSDSIAAKAEFGFANDGAVLRHLWAEYGCGNMKVMVGQNFTGLSDLGSQSTSIIYGLDNLLFGYGAVYDVRHPMVKLTLNDMIYIMLMKGINPAGNNPFGVDKTNISWKYKELPDFDDLKVTIPKINLGMKINFDKFYIHPSFAIALAQYNKDFAFIEYYNAETDTITVKQILDDTIMAYVFALTGKFDASKFAVKFQINYGQNIADYGVKTAVVGNSMWSVDKVENATTMGGYFQCSYTVCPKAVITAGLGYTSGDRKDLTDPDTASTAFLQSNIKLHENLSIVPEVGLIDEMEDGMGNKEGTHTYFGFKMQGDIK